MIAERLPLPWSAYGKFTYSDAGQMRLCLNYAREYWTHEGENSPVGLVLCAEKNLAVTQY